MEVSRRLLAASLFVSMLVAFAMGRTARLLLIQGPRQRILKEFATNEAWNQPPPLAALFSTKGHKVPHTRYSSKNFDMARSVTMSSWLAIDRDPQILETHEHDCPVLDEQNESETCQGHSKSMIIRQDEDIGDGKRPQPTGEHIMVDIKNVDGAFLNSELRLARAIVDLVEEADLQLLSYHCHGFTPVGVSCVGILVRNYLAFHTWPESGVITFDLVASQPKSILPLLSAIERLFGVPCAPSYPGAAVEHPEIRWSYRLRGFHHDPTELSNLFQVTDLGKSMLSVLGTEYKQKVSSLL